MVMKSIGTVSQFSDSVRKQAYECKSQTHCDIASITI